MEANPFIYALKYIAGFMSDNTQKYCTHYLELCYDEMQSFRLRNATSRRVFRYAFKYSLTLSELIFTIFTLIRHII
jgi:hypothetical protein